MLNLSLPTDAYDINVTPDKRLCLLHNEAELLEQFEEFASKLYVAPDAIEFEHVANRENVCAC